MRFHILTIMNLFKVTQLSVTKLLLNAFLRDQNGCLQNDFLLEINSRTTVE